MSSSKKHSQAYRDYLIFLDGGSKVPYHVVGCDYYMMPVNILEQLELDNKLYIKTNNKKYFVGNRTTKFVRSISASEYKLIQNEVNKIKHNRLVTKVQLIMEF